MPEQTTVSTTQVSNEASEARAGERSVWIVTGYIASLLALLGVLAYHFSVYLYN